VPRSVFLGRVIAEGEPLWLPDDRGWAIALARVEADVHHECGRPWSEAMDPANAERYTVDELGVCAACYALAAKRGPDYPQPQPMMRVRLRD
jgi:hypothetical protein